MSELQAHLEDKAEALRSQGLPEAEAAASAAFGDPRRVGARLADIHSRPSRSQTVLAVMPFVLSGVILPILLYAIAAADRALGAAPRVMRVLGLDVNHPLTLAAFFAVVVVIYGVLALGALYALRRGLPLWSASWAGSGLLCAVGFMQMVFDDATATVTLIGFSVFMVACAAALVFVARQRSALLALLIGLSLMLQAGILAAYILSTPPISSSVLAVALAMCLAAAGAVAIVTALYRRSGYLATIVLAFILGMAPYTIRLALTVDATSMATLILANALLPAVLLLLIPYWLGRRDPVAG